MTVCNRCSKEASMFRVCYKITPELGEEKIARFLKAKQDRDNCNANVTCLPEIEIRKDPNMSIADSYWEMQNKNYLGS